MKKIYKLRLTIEYIRQST